LEIWRKSREILRRYRETWGDRDRLGVDRGDPEWKTSEDLEWEMQSDLWKMGQDTEEIEGG
jgi:hypothetical protein